MYPNPAAAAEADRVYLARMAELEAQAKRRQQLNAAMRNPFGRDILDNTGLGGLPDTNLQAPAGPTTNPFARRVEPTYGSNYQIQPVDNVGGLTPSYGLPTGPSQGRSYGTTDYTIDRADPFANPFLRGIGSLTRGG